MQSYSQSRAPCFTICTIFCAVMAGPEGYLRGSFWPVASIFTFVPPTSTTKTFAVFSAFPAFILYISLCPCQNPVPLPKAVAFRRFRQRPSAAHCALHYKNRAPNKSRQTSEKSKKCQRDPRP